MNPDRITLTISQPCNLNWAELAPAEKGRFCSSCGKTVVDFSNLTDAEMLDTLRVGGSNKMCGRFRSSQLERELIEMSSSGTSLLASYVSAKFWATLLLLQSVTSVTSGQKANSQSQIIAEVRPQRFPKRGEIIVCGHVIDCETKLPVPGALVIDSNSGICDSTTAEGQFCLHLSPEMAGKLLQLKVLGENKPNSIFKTIELIAGGANDTKEIIIYRYTVKPNEYMERLRSLIDDQINGHTMGMFSTNANGPMIGKRHKENKRPGLLKRVWNRFRQGRK